MAGDHSSRRRRPELGSAAALALVLAIGFALPVLAPTGDGTLPAPLEPDLVYAAADAPCGGAPMPSPDEVITGSFGPGEEGDYVMLPFEVPSATTAIRVKYCHDQPELAQIPGTSTLNKHTLDMGVYGALAGAGDVWDEDEFRGWGGSSRKDVTISPEGSIDPDPAPVSPSQETTVGYRPGPIEPGEWAVELGVAAIGEEFPGEDGEVQWRVEIDLIDDPAFADSPFQPVSYDETPAKPDPGWYAGDFHVHARHSAPNDATMRETFDFAFAPFGEGAGLDFITLSDYVSDRAWGEIGAFQADYPGKLIVRSSEVITYRGHVNNHTGEFVDYRTGRLLELEPDGSLSVLRAARPASEILTEVRAAGGWNQLNHVETFPSEVPTFGNLCRGCSWEYSDEETDYSLVDSIEVATGPGGLQTAPEPGPNPFTPLAIRFWEDAIDSGGTSANRIAAVGSSDSHNAGTPNDPLTQSPIGQAHTVVKAAELSEQGIGDAIRAGHTYVKIWGADGPDLRLEAKAPGAKRAIIGDVLAAESASFTARVRNLEQARAARPGAYVLFVLRDGEPYESAAIPGSGDSFRFEFESRGEPARYRLQVERTGSGVASIEAVSSPIYLDPRASGAEGRGRCAVRQVGTNGPDRLRGTSGGDRIHGRGGDDRIRGKGGRDCLGGGRGDDRIRAGPGKDVVRAGGGRDRIWAADGKRDVIRCGAGIDRVRADRIDRLHGCERVSYPRKRR